MKRILFFLMGGMLAAGLAAGNSFFVSFPVQAPAGVDAFNAQAPTAAGIVLLRHQIPAEAAVQMAGPDGPGAGRIFTRPAVGSYALTDAGAQWGTAIAQGQTILGLTETYPGQFGWTGKAFVGAFQAVLTKSDIVAGQFTVAPVLMGDLPIPQLSQGSPSAIAVTIPGSVDPSGLIKNWVLWRKTIGNQWEKISDLPFSVVDQAYTDTGVSEGLQYMYGVSPRYDWPGGGQAGALPQETGVFVSQCRSESVWMSASLLQPTPTLFPTLPGAQTTPDIGAEAWMAYPNPNRDGRVHLVFQTLRKSSYKGSFFSIDGTLEKEFSGGGEAGWQHPVIDVRLLASGIYLVSLETEDEAGNKNRLPLRKLAIIR